VAVVRKRTIPTERPPLVGEVSANVIRNLSQVENLQSEQLIQGRTRMIYSGSNSYLLVIPKTSKLKNEFKFFLYGYYAERILYLLTLLHILT
jgi:hypothetical protein